MGASPLGERPTRTSDLQVYVFFVTRHGEGELQVASFHPQYQFADTQPDDIENFTNRSPYPMLHLLREASVERAIAATGDTEEIYRRNIRTLRALGHSGWQRLWRD